MSSAYWCVLIAAILPYVWVAVAKMRPGYNNRNPRAWVARSDNYLVQRANGAHLNAFENFAPFAAGVILAQLAGVDPATVNPLAIAFVVFRVLHGVLYVGDKPLPRSLAWLGGFACSVALIVLAALAAGTELEMAVLQHMLRNRSHVSIEHGALSGPGLLNLYNALCAVRGTAPVHATPDAVSAAACEGSDPLAVQTLELFCGILGSTIGDMALLYGVQGGIYLAGGILPKLGPFLIGSTFVQRFLNKGPMATALQRIPVKLVEHGQLGVIGAASWYLQHRST